MDDTVFAFLIPTHLTRRIALKLLIRSLSLAALLGITVSASAQSFLFETTVAGDYSGSLSVVNGGQTLTVTPEGFPGGSVTVLPRNAPLLQGVIGNQGSSIAGGAFAPLRFTFANPVDTITFGFMDNGGDIDGIVTIQGYDSSNVLLNTLATTDPTYDGSTYQTLSGAFGNASYFTITSSSPPGNTDSLVYEAVASTLATGTPVPEPGSVALLVGAGIGGMMLRRRKK